MISSEIAPEVIGMSMTAIDLIMASTVEPDAAGDDVAPTGAAAVSQLGDLWTSVITD